MTTKRVLLTLGALIVAGSSSAIAPASADAANENCYPGNDCTGFERNAYEVTERRRYVILEVLAAWCCPAGQGQIDYETVNGSAVAGEDYQRTAGTLTFAGNGLARIQVPISDDASSEGEEQFVVRLTEFRGSFSSRGYESAVVTIRDRSPDEAASDAFWANRSSQPDVLRTDTAPPTAAARPISPASSASGSPPPSSPVLDKPVLTDARNEPLTDRRAGNNATAPVAARKAAGGRTSPVPPRVLACLLLATMAISGTALRRISGPTPMRVDDHTRTMRNTDRLPESRANGHDRRATEREQS